MVPVIYAPEAERDLEAITTFIAKDNPLAAEQFGFRLIERAELLGIFPRTRTPGTWKTQRSRAVGKAG
jgi:plasmid stabilization system protein ParE